MKHFRDWNFATKQSVLILALLAVVGVGINYTVRREVRKIMGREITRAAGTARAAFGGADGPAIS